MRTVRLPQVAMLGLGLLVIGSLPALAQPPAPPVTLDTFYRLHHDNQHEIEMGKLAQQNSSNAKVRAYGQRLERDHTSADEQLSRVAGKIGIDLTRAEATLRDDPSFQAEQKSVNQQMERVRNLKGAEFDREFLTMMMADHDRAILLVSKNTSKITNSEARNLMGKLLPVLRQHRRLAADLLKQVGPTG